MHFATTLLLFLASTGIDAAPSAPHGLARRTLAAEAPLQPHLSTPAVRSPTRKSAKGGKGGKKPKPPPPAPPAGTPAAGAGGGAAGGNKPAAGPLDPSLVPDFGVVRGTNAGAQQAGSCDGFNGSKNVLIPCFCPPDRQEFISKLSSAVAQGNVLGDPINFSTDVADQSEATNRQRATAMTVMLQNFNGTKGVGCPAASAPNFSSQQKNGVFSNKVFVG